MLNAPTHCRIFCLIILYQTQIAMSQSAGFHLLLSQTGKCKIWKIFLFCNNNSMLSKAVFTNRFSTILVLHFHFLNKENWEPNVARHMPARQLKSCRSAKFATPTVESESEFRCRVLPLHSGHVLLEPQTKSDVKITAVSENNETVTFFVPRYPKIDILNSAFISHSFSTHIRLEHVSSNPQNTPAFIPIMLQHFGTQEDEIWWNCISPKWFSHWSSIFGNWKFVESVHPVLPQTCTLGTLK
jgi:hypothetical protein